jgi:hypothetical protein
VLKRVNFPITRSLNAFDERARGVCGRQSGAFRLNGASPGGDGRPWRKRGIGERPLRSPGAVIMWRRGTGRGAISAGNWGLKPAQGHSCALLRNRGMCPRHARR